MLLETSSNLFSNNSTPLPLQFNCFYSPKTELHFIFSSYNTDKKQCYCSINAMFSLCNSSVFTFYFLCFSHLKPIILHPISYLITITMSIFLSTHLITIQNKESNIQERASMQKRSIFTPHQIKLH